MRLRSFLCGVITVIGTVTCVLLVTAESERPGKIVQQEGKISVLFEFENEKQPLSDAIDATLMQSIKEMAKNRQFKYYQEVDSTQEAADLLGIQLLRSTLLEEIPQSELRLETNCTRTLKLERTTFKQEYDTGEYAIQLIANTLWEEGIRQNYEYYVQDGYTLETIPYTTGTGQDITVFYLQDEKSRILRLFTMFMYENTQYTLYAYCDGYMVRDKEGDYIPSSVSKDFCLQVLDSLEPTT